MIDIKDIRIGNLLNNSNIGEVTVVSEIAPSLIMSLSLDGEYGHFNNTDTFSGIPLTKEWLLELGFIKDSRHSLSLQYPPIHTDVDFPFNNGYKGKPEVALGYSGSDFGRCKYVHQIQNLYYALTGKEMPISLITNHAVLQSLL